jgi:hypothetical protein
MWKSPRSGTLEAAFTYRLNWPDGSHGGEAAYPRDGAPEVFALRRWHRR